jgi:hypothetical protein
MINTMFETTAKRLGLLGRHDDHDEDAKGTTFQRPAKPTTQLSLF